MSSLTLRVKGSASLWGNVASASIAALTVVIASWMIDFGRDMHIAPLFETLSKWSLTRTVKTFEDGVLATDAVLYLVFLTAGFLLAAHVLLHPDIWRKGRALALLAMLLGALLAGAARWTWSGDLTESERNSFPARYERILRAAPSLEIDIYLERTDSRAKDFEKSFLKRLSLAAPRARVRWMTGEPLKEHYGQFAYRVDRREERTFSNSDEEIFLILAALAGAPPPDLNEESGYPGYPLVTNDAQQRLALLVYILGMSLVLAIKPLGTRLLRHKRGVGHES